MEIIQALMAFSLFTAVGQSPSPVAWKHDPGLFEPFWNSGTMRGESLLFVAETPEALPAAKLLFSPLKVLKIQDPALAKEFVQGRDYVWKPDDRAISLPKGSSIPFKTPADLIRPPKSQRHALTRCDGKGEILFGGGHEYHDMQVTVTYEHRLDEWKGGNPAIGGANLTRVRGKLPGKETVSIALLGDSISTGCNASGWAGTAPFQPAWQDLVRAGLEASRGAKVALHNFSVGGTSSAWGLKNIDKVIDVKPDLVIIAFGMNDSAGVPAAQYTANIRGMIDAVRKRNPDAEFILVATMQGNADWVTLKQELFPAYREALAGMVGPGVALADLTGIWKEMLRHKADRDLTGNGVNHPNDFGHRVYAQVLLALLQGP